MQKKQSSMKTKPGGHTSFKPWQVDVTASKMVAILQESDKKLKSATRLLFSCENTVMLTIALGMTLSSIEMTASALLQGSLLTAF